MGNFYILFWDMKGERQKDWAVKLQKYSQGQEAMGRTDVALELALHAKKLGTFGPSLKAAASQVRTNRAQRLQCLFPTRPEREAGEGLEAGQTASLKGRLEEALRVLKQGRDLLRGFDRLELFLRLSNSMSEVYFQTGCYKRSSAMPALTQYLASKSTRPRTLSSPLHPHLHVHWAGPALA